MLNACECGMNCPPCEDCGEPECECKCYEEEKIEEEDEEKEW